MSITDELRKWFDRYTMRKDVYDELTAIADRIDVEHEEQMADAFETRNSDENLEADGWVRLPVDGEAPSKQLAEWIERRGLVAGPLDASGELWHSGDMSDSNWGVIEGIAFEDGRWLISGHDTSAPWVPAGSIRHHHAPTVEDVLREFAKKVCEGDHIVKDGKYLGIEDADLLAEYAAKLRLAGDAE